LAENENGVLERDDVNDEDDKEGEGARSPFSMGCPNFKIQQLQLKKKKERIKKRKHTRICMSFSKSRRVNIKQNYCNIRIIH
jgi:hypothetical protein